MVHAHLLLVAAEQGERHEEDSAVRFQAVERVSSGDSERVLIALEQHLRRRVPGDVERDGSRIILSGLGPSLRTINPRDTTVIDVREENGTTTIDAEVSFQASALLAPMGQEEIVRGKLQRIFVAAKRQVESESGEHAAYQPPASSAEPSGEVRVEAIAAQPVSAASAEAAASPLVESVAAASASAGDAAIVTEGPVAAEEKDIASKVSPVEPRSAAGVVPVVEVRDKPLPEAKESKAQTVAPQARGTVRSGAAPVRDAVGDSGASRRMEYASEMPEEKQGTDRRWMRWAAAAACLAVIVGFLGWHYWPVQQKAPVIELEQSAVSRPAAPPADIGPEAALRQWELAQRSSDAGSQAAYYTFPVQQYMWKHNVNRHDLQAMKQAEIDRRRGLWTVKMENVEISRKGGEATVTLVKHTIEQLQGSTARSRFVKSQLTLKNSLGIWWITSERDLVQPRTQASDTATEEDEGETPSWARPLAAPAAPAAGPNPSSAAIN